MLDRFEVFGRSVTTPRVSLVHNAISMRLNCGSLIEGLEQTFS
jgi:hypothetical protein